MEISRFHFTACSRSNQKFLQAAIVGLWKRSHTSPRENIATDNHTLYEHTQREYRNALQLRALLSHGLGCSEVSTRFTVMNLKLATMARTFLQIQGALAKRKPLASQLSNFNCYEFCDADVSTTELVSFNGGER